VEIFFTIVDRHETKTPKRIGFKVDQISRLHRFSQDIMLRVFWSGLYIMCIAHIHGPNGKQGWRSVAEEFKGNATKHAMLLLL